MEKTTQNVRRSLRRVLTLLLALVMTLSLAVQAFAAIGNWPATGDTTVDRYMQNSGTFYNGDTVIAPKYSNFGGFINVYSRLWKYVTTRSTKPREYTRIAPDGTKTKHRVVPTLGERAAHNSHVIYSIDFRVTPHMLRHTYITLSLIHI